MKHRYIVLILVACCFPALYGIFHPGFFVSDDGGWMVIRLSAFYSALSSGQFPTRFLPQLNNGIGYPVADFLYPLFLYIGSLLHVVKIPFILDIKIILAGSVIFSGIGMHLFLRKHFSNFAAFFGALLYVYLPYHVYDLYARGSVGEVVSLAIIPFLFWAVERDSFILSAVFLGLLIPAHNTLALFFLPAAAGYALVKKMSLKKITGIVLLGLGLAAFFWIPALIDKQFTIFDSVAVANPFNYFVDTVSYQLVGWIAIALIGGVLFFRFSLKDRRMVYFISVAVISLFFSISLSSVFWHVRALAEFIQFPFRFLSFFLIAESFFAAYILEKSKQKIISGVFLTLIVLFSALPFLLPKSYSYQPDAFYATNVDTTTVHNEYMPKWVMQVPTSYAHQRVIVNPSNGFVGPVIEKGTNVKANVSMQKKGVVIMSFAYFPGWKITDNGKEIIAVPAVPSGLLQVTLLPGTHILHSVYSETFSDYLADSVSIVSIGIVLYLVWRKKYLGKAGV